MSISDGFKLWMGKALADLAIAGVIIGLIVLGFLVLMAISTYQEWRRKRRSVSASPDPK